MAEDTERLLALIPAKINEDSESLLELQKKLAALSTLCQEIRTEVESLNGVLKIPLPTQEPSEINTAKTGMRFENRGKSVFDAQLVDAFIEAVKDESINSFNGDLKIVEEKSGTLEFALSPEKVIILPIEKNKKIGFVAFYIHENFFSNTLTPLPGNNGRDELDFQREAEKILFEFTSSVVLKAQEYDDRIDCRPFAKEVSILKEKTIFMRILFEVKKGNFEMMFCE